MSGRRPSGGAVITPIRPALWLRDAMAAHTIAPQHCAGAVIYDEPTDDASSLRPRVRPEVTRG